MKRGPSCWGLEQLGGIGVDLVLANAQRIFVTGRANFSEQSGRIERCGLGARVAARNYGITLTVAPRLPVFHSALRFPMESAFEREGFIVQASA